MGQIAFIVPLFIVGLAFALIGWAIMVLTSRIERRRRVQHPELVSERQEVESPALTQPRPWIRFLGRWLALSSPPKGHSAISKPRY